MTPAPPSPPLEVAAMQEELMGTLEALRSWNFLAQPAYAGMPPELSQLRQVALSGDGDALLCPVLHKAQAAVLQVRAGCGLPFFKIVLITTGATCPSPSVRAGLALLTAYDELWVQLDAGTQEYYQRVRGPAASLPVVLENIAALGQTCDLVIQRLFMALEGKAPAAAEVEAYVARLRALSEAGIRILRVQISSVPDGAIFGGASHLALQALSDIAVRVRAAIGLVVEIF